ncbi:hypothetical protein [Candidatus Entotheonella palauensis]|uniref:Uncharacterized protein n=1 Tax=Candidatus Entotheonella gemina TaxID=1429439 RepID=W4LFR8_9BACT|nr:hypothetical protein [Candidatus Entotheonella palauensis]ETW96744.1 MAG: hypothetical protein ETSY2_45865 [Candidatus Entotheonella gemina]
MAKKSKRQGKAGKGKGSASRGGGLSQRWLLGGLGLLLVIGVAGVLRFGLQRDIPLRLQGAIDNHYARGADQAAVVIKEFSDYT